MLNSVFGQIMCALLIAQYAWEVVKNGYTVPEDEGALTVAQLRISKEKKMKDQATLYLMYQGVDELGFEKIVEATTAKEAWNTLKSAYKGAERVKQVRLHTLREELKGMKMNDTKDVSTYIMRVQTVVNQLKRNGVVEEVVYKDQPPGYTIVGKEAYAKEDIRKSKKEECKPVVTPMKPSLKLSKFEGGQQANAGEYRSLVGTLRYLTFTSPDLERGKIGARKLSFREDFVDEGKFPKIKDIIKEIDFG